MRTSSVILWRHYIILSTKKRAIFFSKWRDVILDDASLRGRLLNWSLQSTYFGKKSSLSKPTFITVFALWLRQALHLTHISWLKPKSLLSIYINFFHCSPLNEISLKTSKVKFKLIIKSLIFPTVIAEYQNPEQLAIKSNISRQNYKGTWTIIKATVHLHLFVLEANWIKMNLHYSIFILEMIYMRMGLLR